ncbi:hypothetical protein ACFJGW_14945 [Burkholderiaceae bacterium UC74_6]
MSDELFFLEEDQGGAVASMPWVVLIVDDEALVHDSTRMALAGSASMAVGSNS